MFKHLFQSDAVKQLLGSYNKPMRKSKSLDIKDLQTVVTSEKGKKCKISLNPIQIKSHCPESWTFWYNRDRFVKELKIRHCLTEIWRRLQCS